MKYPKNSGIDQHIKNEVLHLGRAKACCMQCLRAYLCSVPFGAGKYAKFRHIIGTVNILPAEPGQLRNYNIRADIDNIQIRITELMIYVEIQINKSDLVNKKISFPCFSQLVLLCCRPMW